MFQGTSLPSLARAAFGAAVLSFAMAAVHGPASAQTAWDLASGYPATTFHTENLVAFAKDVDARTQGQLKIAVHPNSSLFKTNEIKRAVQSGQTQAGEIFLLQYENESPLFALDGVPFLASNYDDAWKLYEAQRPALNSYFEKQGLALLYAVPWQPQGLQSKRAVQSLADLRGVKWRAYSAATARMGELMGAYPVTVLSSELTQALATGQVEAMISSSQTAVDIRVHESFGFFYDIKAWVPKNAVLVNAKAFSALTPQQQDAVKRAAAAAEQRGWKLSAERDEESKKTIAARGMNVSAPSPKLATEFRQMGATMMTQWQQRAGATGDSILQAYKNSLQGDGSVKAKP